MFKDLKYYQDLSKQLETEIEIYEGSYQDFEKVIDIDKDKIRDWTEEQKTVATEFVNFYKDEGIYDKGLNKERYPEIKEGIKNRVDFLKERKALVDRMVSLYQKLDDLKNKGEIDEDTKKQLKARASKKYGEGTKEYTDYLEKMTNSVIKKRVEETKSGLDEAKSEISKFKKQNGFAKVISSVFGLPGNKVYNTYAWLHNKNVDLRKKRVLNLVVKLAMVFGYTSLIATLIPVSSLSFAAVAVIGGIVGLYNTIKHTFQKVPDKLSLKEKPSTLRDSWFKFRKSRGKNKLTTEKALYQEIDFSKYSKVDDDKPLEKVSEEDSEEKTDTKEEEKLEEKSDTKEEEKIEEKTETKEEEKIEENTINSLASVMAELRNFDAQGGIKTIADWQKLNEIRKYLDKQISKTGDNKYIELRNMFDNVRKTISKDLRDKIDTYKTFENVNNNKGDFENQMKKATKENRQQEFSKIINLLQNANLDQTVLNDVNSFLSHYNVSKEQYSKIMSLLQEREKQSVENVGRGK